MNDEIGKRVRKIRLQKGISQEKFGELIGIKKSNSIKNRKWR